jgi:hypothetical protein
MGIMVAQDLLAPRYRFTDPNALLSCDNPACSTSWVTRDGLVCWEVSEAGPVPSLFVDRLLVACSTACLREAQRRIRRRWSEPMPAGAWLEAIRNSLEMDPASTPIGALASAT